MAANSFVVSHLFADSVVRHAFKAVLDQRSMRVKDIKAQVFRNRDVNAQQELDGALTSLVEAKLVKESRTEIRDFDTIYVTADGLGLKRQLKEAERLFDGKS